MSQPQTIFRFDPHQQAWIDDPARFAAANKARQIGYTFAEAYRIVESCLSRRKKHYLLSVSEARAWEALEYAAMFSQAMGAAGVVKDWAWEDVHYARSRIVWPHGSEFVALPANPRTARGASGDLTLDEVAWYLHDEQIWTACQPLATRGYALRVISTPNGRRGLFHRLWTGGGRATPEDISEALDAGLQPIGDAWSRHETSIRQAVATAWPESVLASLDLALVRELAGTEENWLQEYLCQFLDEATAWLPYSLIESCTADGATLDFDHAQSPSGPCWLGFDVGRKRDLSVGWLNEQRGAVHTTRAVVTLDRQPFKAQKQVLWDLLRIARRGCVDETGIGIQLAEEALEHWGEHHVVPVTFSSQMNARLASKLKQTMELGQLELPDCPHVRADLHSVRRMYTENGRQSFDAERGREGHADRFWAAALALHASDDALLPLQPNEVKTLPTGRRGLGERTFGRSWGDY